MSLDLSDVTPIPEFLNMSYLNESFTASSAQIEMN